MNQDDYEWDFDGSVAHAYVLGAGSRALCGVVLEKGRTAIVGDPKCQRCVGRGRKSGEGRKNDAEKARWDLVPWRAFARVVDVLTFGARKYADWNWVKVPGAEDRYFAALLRHVMARRRGERVDPETGLPHLAHAMCCALFLLALDEGDTAPGAAENKPPEEK